MVEKVDIISAPSKFSTTSVNSNNSQPTAQNGQDSKRNVDWKTLAVAGTAIAAIVGAIILIRRGNAGKAEETLSSTTSHTGSADHPKPPVDPEAELKRLFEKYKDCFALCDKLTYETFKSIINSPEFATLKKMRQNVSKDGADFLSCKIVTGRLADVFGDSFPKHIFERTIKEATDEEIIQDIAQRNYFLGCNRAIVDAKDATGNLTKYRNGVSILPYHAEINPVTNKLNIVPGGSSFKIYSDGNGRYIKVEKGFTKNEEWEYINPEEISEKTPRLTNVAEGHSVFRLKEKGDKNELSIFFGDINNEKRLAFSYNPETKQIYEANIIDEIGNPTPVKDKDILSEIAEIFDFKKLSEKDYLTTIRDMVGEILK